MNLLMRLLEELFVRPVESVFLISVTLGLLTFALAPSFRSEAASFGPKSKFVGLLVPLAISMMLGTIAIFVVSTPFNIGHKDEIGLLYTPLVPTIYSGRFFPLGHMEFNLLGLQLTKGNFAPLYLLPFIQINISLISLNYLLSRVRALPRTLLLVSAIWVVFMIPMNQLIVPERNQLFFILLGLACYKIYSKGQPKIFAGLTVFFLSLSLYYKEPTFLIVAGIGVISIIFAFQKMSSHDFVNNELRKKGDLVIGVMLLLASALFLLAYCFFVYFHGAPTSLYANGDQTNLLTKASELLSLPITWAFMVSISIFAIWGEKTRENFILILGFSFGGIAYCAAIMYLGLPNNGYYLAAAYLCFILSAGYVLVSLEQKNKSTRFTFQKGLQFLLVTVVVWVSLSQSRPIISEIQIKTNFQAEYAFLEANIPNSTISSMYYSPSSGAYGDYATAIMMIFLNNKNIDHQFTIYSPSGCAEWNEFYNEGKIHCVKSEFSSLDQQDLDLIIAESPQDIIVMNEFFKKNTFNNPYPGNPAVPDQINLYVSKEIR